MTVRKKYPADFKAKIVLEILKEEKSISQISSEYGIHTTQLNRWRNQALEGLSQIFTDERKNTEALKAGYEKQMQDLYAEVGRLTTQLNWLKKNLESDLTRDERKSLIEWENPDLSVKTQAELLDLNRSSLYYKPVQPTSEEIAIKHRIDEIYTAYPFYGSRWIAAQLNREEIHINRKTVQRHMREMGIA